MLEYNTEADGRFRVAFTTAESGRIEVVGRPNGEDVEATGAEELVSNSALTAALADYGRDTLAARQADSETKRARKEKAAEDAERRARFIAALNDAPIADRVEDRWCSACFQKADQTLREPGDGYPSAYLCSNCGSPTTPCAAPGCPNFARRHTSSFSVLDYCAEHTHEIPSFETANAKLREITDYADWLQYAQPNLEKRKSAAFALASPLLAAGAALNPSTLVSKAYGGGLSSVSDGLDLATDVLGSFGRELGQATGARLAAGVAREDKSFDVEELRSGKGAPVLLANGFLSESVRGWDKWQRMVDERYPKRPVYRICWGAQELDSLKPFINAAADRGVDIKTADAVKDALKIGGPFAAGAMATEAVAKWQIAKQRATNTGLVLADLIARTETPRYVLLGFSLGVRVMATAARALADAGFRDEDARLAEVHLLGGAILRSYDWEPLVRATRHGVWNYYSHNDAVLSMLFKTAEFGGDAVGFVGMGLEGLKLHDIDVSDIVPSHQSYLERVSLERR